MNAEYLQKMTWKAHYLLKAGTGASYYRADFVSLQEIDDAKERKLEVSRKIGQILRSGEEMLLPIRLSIVQGNSLPVNHSGRGTRNRMAQLKGAFTQPEQSPYKQYSPYHINTSVWQVEGFKCLFYGTIGISFPTGIADNGDLVIFKTSDWIDITIYIFKGLAKPNEEANLEDAVNYVLQDK